MRELIVPALAALILSAGCDDRRADSPADAADDRANKDAAEKAVNQAVAETREPTLEARVSTLERDVDELKARLQTKQDLAAAALAGMMQPPIAPPANFAISFGPGSGQ